jgi:Protein of unknown function (DUF3455)
VTLAGDHGDMMSVDTSSYTDTTTANPFVLTPLNTPGSAALRIENSELPAEIQVDETKNCELTRRLGIGVQVYDCDPTDGSFKFREPQANLYDLETPAQRGIHFVGPRPRTAQWTDVDGSRVIAEVDGSIDAPPPADATQDIRWLRLKAIEHFRNGRLARVSFIQRVLTYGGQPPPSGADDSTISQPYTTLYIFWEPR